MLWNNAVPVHGREQSTHLKMGFKKKKNGMCLPIYF